MPDELTPGAEAPPAAPQPLSTGGPATVTAGERPPRRPSWLRAVAWSLLVLAAGVALGGGIYRWERAHGSRPAPVITRTAEGWRATGRRTGQYSGLTLAGSHLLWQDGALIEYLDLDSGKLRLVGPGPGMRATWAPAASDRYAVWFEADHTRSIAASAVAYDFSSGRRWTAAAAGTVYSLPAVSGGTAVWCGATAVTDPRIRVLDIVTGQTRDVGKGPGSPDVSGGLVVWADGPSGPFTAVELSGGSAWPVVPSGLGGTLVGFSLENRTLVWTQKTSAGGGAVLAADVDGRLTSTVLASGVPGLAGPSFDGTTAVWAESAGAGRSRIVGRRLDGSAAFTIAEVAGTVTDVAVSGDTAAWISDGVRPVVETARVPR